MTVFPLAPRWDPRRRVGRRAKRDTDLPFAASRNRRVPPKQGVVLITITNAADTKGYSPRWCHSSSRRPRRNAATSESGLCFAAH